MALAFTSLAHADGVYSKWSMPPFDVQGISMQFTLDISPNSVISTAQCTYPDGVVNQASVTSKAIVTDSTLQILENVSNKNSSDPDHTLSNGLLVLSDNSGKTITLTPAL